VVNKICDGLRNREFLIPQSWDTDIGEILVSPNLATLQWVGKNLNMEQVLALINWNGVPVQEKYKSTYSFSTVRTVHRIVASIIFQKTNAPWIGFLLALCWLRMSGLGC
jgi:hypothetical protein